MLTYFNKTISFLFFLFLFCPLPLLPRHLHCHTQHICTNFIKPNTNKTYLCFTLYVHAASLGHQLRTTTTTYKTMCVQIQARVSFVFLLFRSLIHTYIQTSASYPVRSSRLRENVIYGIGRRLQQQRGWMLLWVGEGERVTCFVSSNRVFVCPFLEMYAYLELGGKISKIRVHFRCHTCHSPNVLLLFSSLSYTHREIHTQSLGKTHTTLGKRT